MRASLLAISVFAAASTAVQQEEFMTSSDFSEDDECHLSGSDARGECALNALQRRGMFRDSVSAAASLQGEDCHNAVAGEACYDEVQWAKTQGILQHPEWYPGLTASSESAQFQQVVHQNTPAKCPKPCIAGQDCRDAVAGEACWDEVQWAKTQGILQHPEWYPGLDASSAPTQFQQVVHQNTPAKCPRPCIAGGARALPPPAVAAPLPAAPSAEAEAAAEAGKWCASVPPPKFWKPSSDGAALQVKVLSYNLFWWSLFRQRGGNHESAGKLIKSTMADQPYDFMGFQECEDSNRVLAGVGLLKQYGTFQGAHAVCVAYDKTRWTVLAHGTQEVAEDMPQRWYGKRGAQWMRLEHKETRRTALFVNHHGPLSVNSGGLCGGRATANNILKLMATKGAPGDLLILVGDFNANAASATIQGLWPHLVHVYNGDSWGGVDNIFSNIDTGAIVSTKTLGAGGSDHDAISAVLRVGGMRMASAGGSEPGKAVRDLVANPPGHSWQTFWCGKEEPDIEYTFPAGAETWAARDGRAPDWCCRECQDDKRCKSWRWAKEASPLCLLSAAMPVGKVAKPGHVNVVSGLPAPSAAAVATSNSRMAVRSA